MPPVPLLSPSDVIKMFQRHGWQVVRQKGSHIIMTTLSIPSHSEVARGTLRSLIAKAGLTIEQFLEASK
ncbi:MAG: type II toxin-antitoxin system HicA family toxin [Nitrospira sp.]|nr:type II toxin-antitoxin system HicA family toxin [Nitrospira sp.]